MTGDERCCPPATAEEDIATCTRARGAVTNEEVAVLGAMRELKAEVRELKCALRSAEAGGDEPAAARGRKRLDEAHRRWTELEHRRDDARRRRMIMLGHVAD